MSTYKNRRLLSALLAVIMLLGIMPFATIAAENTYPTDPEEYQVWKENLISSAEEIIDIDTSDAFSISPFALNGNLMYNEYIEAYVGNDGKYTMGTTGGNPNTSSDDYKLLLYGHPGSTTSETLIRIDGIDTYFSAGSTIFNANGTQATSVGMIGDVEVMQVLAFENNPHTNRPDVISIRYTLTNRSSASKQIGARIMLDTMLGYNDGAPFRVPGIGNVTTELELSGNAIPEYWQAFDNLTNPTVIATGTFYRTESERPDKVQFCSWPGIRMSSWDYSVTDGYIFYDSAVAAYFNPRVVPAGQSRTVVTYYGISDFSNADLTPPLSLRVTSPSFLTGTESGAYLNNPFDVTAYIENTGSGTATNVRAMISLPSELRLEGSSQNTISIGNIAVGGERLARWNVRALPQSTEMELYFTVTITADNVPTKVLTIPLQLYTASVLYRTVRFDLNGATGTPPSPQQVLIGTYATKPANPSRDGYRFVGWYANSQGTGLEWFSIFNFANVILSDTTLYAKWQREFITPDDLFSFRNSVNDFNDTYAISNEYFNILTRNMNASLARDMRNERDSAWEGSCSGMGMAEALFAVDELRPGYFYPGAANARSINTTPRQDSRIESLVNFYQLSQYLSAFSNARSASTRGKSQRDLAEDMVRLARAAESTGDFVYVGTARYTTGLLGSRTRHGGHALFGWKVTDESNGDLKVHLFESNSHDLTSSYFIVKSDYSNVTYYCSWSSDWNGINSNASTLDITSLLNRAGYNQINVQTELLARGHSIAPFSAVSIFDFEAEPILDTIKTNYSLFEISGDNGKQSQIDGDSYEGTLPIVDSYSNETGTRNSYYFESNNQYIISPALTQNATYSTFVLFDDVSFVGATLSANNQIKLESSGSIEVIANGSNVVDITVESTISDVSFPWETTKVITTTTDLKLVPERDFATISSSKSLGEFTVEATRGENVYTVLVNTSDTMVKISYVQVGNVDYIVAFNGVGEEIARSGLTYSVDFYTYGGSVVDSLYGVQYGSTIFKPEDPIFEGFVFGGWYKDSECTDGQEWDFDNDTIVIDTILHAKWIGNSEYMHRVTFRAEDNDDIIVLVLHGESLIEIPPVPEKDNMIGQWDMDDFSSIVSDMIVNAVYTSNSNIVITTTTGTGGSVFGGGSYAPGSTVTLIATPNTDYSFDGWYEDDSKIVGAGASYIFTATADRTLEARFIPTTLMTYTITATAGTGGSVSGSGTYDEGATVTLIAIPNTNYTFNGWYDEDNLIIGEIATYTFIATEDKILEARFISFSFEPITSLIIDSPAMTSMSRNSTLTFNLILNPGASDEGLVWMISDPSYATVDAHGTVTTRNKAGIVMLMVQDPASGISHLIAIRIS